MFIAEKGSLLVNGIVSGFNFAFTNVVISKMFLMKKCFIIQKPIGIFCGGITANNLTFLEP